MPVRHVVKQGETLSMLAERAGLSPDTIWNHPDNEALRSTRSRGDVLLPGDEVVIPDRRRKDVDCQTDQVHRFRRRGVPMRFSMQVFDPHGTPRADLPYELEVDHVLQTGTTDADGRVDTYVPTSAKTGELRIEGAPPRLLAFGQLDPIETLIGVQKRLTNLGFPCVQDAGALGRATVWAVRSFQRVTGLSPTGELDDSTCEEIRACHDDPDRYAEHLAREQTGEL